MIIFHAFVVLYCGKNVIGNQEVPRNGRTFKGFKLPKKGTSLHHCIEFLFAHVDLHPGVVIDPNIRFQAHALLEICAPFEIKPS